MIDGIKENKTQKSVVDWMATIIITLHRSVISLLVYNSSCSLSWQLMMMINVYIKHPGLPNGYAMELRI